MSINSDSIPAMPGDGMEYWQPQATSDAAASGNEQGLWGADGFNFADVLDLVNPLQHLPIVGTIYRAITGDQIAPAARLIGGAVFGGPIGLVSAMVNVAVEESTGDDLGNTVLALLRDEPSAPTNVANASPPVVVAALAPPPVTAPVQHAQTRNVQSAVNPAPRLQPMPNLSPAAFDALMRSVGAAPAAATASPAAASGAEDAAPAERVFFPIPTSRSGSLKFMPIGAEQRRAAMELHDLLRSRPQAAPQQ